MDKVQFLRQDLVIFHRQKVLFLILYFSLYHSLKNFWEHFIKWASYFDFI
jgi:hypothetical protein